MGVFYGLLCPIVDFGIVAYGLGRIGQIFDPAISPSVDGCGTAWINPMATIGKPYFEYFDLV
jgi:hypothetical protein